MNESWILIYKCVVLTEIISFIVAVSSRSNYVSKGVGLGGRTCGNGTGWKLLESLDCRSWDLPEGALRSRSVVLIIRGRTCVTVGSPWELMATDQTM